MAARDVQLAVVHVGLGLGVEVPVELGVELVGEGGRDLDVQAAVAAGRWTTTCGRRRARPVGAGTTFCPTSCAPRTTLAGSRSSTARADRCACPSSVPRGR